MNLTQALYAILMIGLALIPQLLSLWIDSRSDSQAESEYAQ